jgi:hypothetical protein
LAPEDHSGYSSPRFGPESLTFPARLAGYAPAERPAAVTPSVALLLGTSRNEMESRMSSPQHKQEGDDSENPH